jgi:hypothetical protein
MRTPANVAVSASLAVEPHAIDHHRFDRRRRVLHGLAGGRDETHGPQGIQNRSVRQVEF